MIMRQLAQLPGAPQRCASPALLPPLPSHRPHLPCFPSFALPLLHLSSGRKRAALTYCITYALGCMTKHVNSFWVLACGRVLW